MASPKITIVFYSTYGTNHAVAQTAEAAAKEAGAEVRLRRVAETAPREVVESQEAWKAQLEKMSDIPEASGDDMEWADGYFFICPTRFGTVASQMRVFIDTLGPQWFAEKLADKTATAATSANSTHAGQEATLLGLYTTFMHWGCLIVPPGFRDQSVFDAGGNPYGFSKNAGELDDAGRAAISFQAKRLVEYTDKIRS